MRTPDQGGWEGAMGRWESQGRVVGPGAKKESVSRGQQLCQVPLRYPMRRGLRLRLVCSHMEVTVTLMRAITGKQRGTSLTQVDSTAHSRDTALGESLDWKIPNVAPWALQFYSLIIFIWRKFWFVEGRLQRNKLSQFLKVAKAFGEGITSAAVRSNPHVNPSLGLSPRCPEQSPAREHTFECLPSLMSLFLTILLGFPGIQYQINDFLSNLCLRSTSWKYKTGYGEKGSKICCP